MIFKNVMLMLYALLMGHMMDIYDKNIKRL